ncbi:ABC transporter permease [Mycolicibacterium holsaticum]|uniref:ABC transporter permease n=1 Tax=Mycolicibacterium holsaticum TaxID=152142 RepID=UPI001C7DE4C3|nr:iron ABC transporter permease [Mycolicibacterium holsaticum]QZA12699.1 iron ABC transporter permease [Mycolicibacterium holsaticum DSM 44478 = JCM 12374]
MQRRATAAPDPLVVHDEPPVPAGASPSVRQGMRYRFRVAAGRPTTVLGVLGLVLFGYLIVVPIVTMVIQGVTVGPRDTLTVQRPAGSLTSYYLWRVFLSPVAGDLFWRPLLHTVIVSACSVALSLLLGGLLAWLLARTDVFARRWFSTALIVPYMLPTWAFALAWSTVFKNRTAGGQPGWLESIGFTPPDWLAYGGIPITIIFTLYFSPLVILLLGNALERFDPQLEDSARSLGAGYWTVVRTILIPLMRPAILSAATLILAKVLGEFGVTYILGLPTDFNVLATSLYRNISTRDSGAAAVIASAIIVIGLLSLWVDVHFLKEARRFVTIGGKGSTNRIQLLGRLRVPATALCGLAFVLSVIVPIGVLLLSTLMHRPADFSLDNFTLSYWFGHDLDTAGFTDGILVSSAVWSAAWNTFWIVGVAAVCAGVLGQLVGYVVVRSPSRLLATTLRQLTFLPYLVPGIAFAVAYLSLFAVPRGPIPALYGTAAILVLIYMAEQMPFASRAGISSMMQLGSDLEDAAQAAGAGWWRRMAGIVLPIQKRSLATGMLLPFIAGVRSLSLVVILTVPGMDVLTTFALKLVEFGFTQAANGVVLIVSAIAFGGTYAIQKTMKADLGRGLGE